VIDFGEPQEGPRGESIVPMINVVFLLLIFFLMSATLAPPDPFDVAPPEAEGVQAGAPTGTLYLAADGRLAYGPVRGDAVFAPIAAATPRPESLTLRADGAVPGAEVARVLERLAIAGVTTVEIVAVAPWRM